MLSKSFSYTYALLLALACQREEKHGRDAGRAGIVVFAAVVFHLARLQYSIALGRAAIINARCQCCKQVICECGSGQLAELRAGQQQLAPPVPVTAAAAAVAWR